MLFTEAELAVELEAARYDGCLERYLILHADTLTVWSRPNKEAFLDFAEIPYEVVMTLPASRCFSGLRLQEERDQLEGRLRSLGHDIQWFERGHHE